jgi:signal transduction histidine kinase
MKLPAGMGRLAWFTLAGAGVGFLLLHPFAMLAYTLGPQHTHLSLDPAFWGRELKLAFSSGMLHMGLAFVLLGGVSGGLLGAWLAARERLAAARLEAARRLTALNTLQELMITLAHYIRNANLVIGGFSHRLAKRLAEPEIKDQLHLILKASHEIEAVIASLQHLTEINTTPYTAAGQSRIIDLKNELEVRLATKARKEQHES